MDRFNSSDIDLLDAIWRDVDAEHPWTGWAQIEAESTILWVFRKRANWRRFVLRCTPSGYCLEDERGDDYRYLTALQELPDAIAAMPTLAERALD